jgi:hypothetical protein
VYRGREKTIFETLLYPQTCQLDGDRRSSVTLLETSQDVFFLGVLHGIKAFVPRMIEHGTCGHVLAKSSGAGTTGTMDTGPGYATTKAAVCSLMECLYGQLRDSGADIQATVVAHPDNAHRPLREEGRLVAVFPQGAKGSVKPKSDRYRLQRFGRGGFVETAMRAGVPILPIVLMGTEDTTPTLLNLELGGTRMPLTLNTVLFGPILGAVAHFPAKIRAQVLPPVVFEESPEQPMYPRSLLMDRAEGIRGDMQETLDAMYDVRESRGIGKTRPAFRTTDARCSGN